MMPDESPDRVTRFGDLSLSKNYDSNAENRAAGERERARPVSQYNKPPQKSLKNQAFRAKQHFGEIKMLGG